MRNVDYRRTQMTIAGYLSEHWALLILLIGLATILLSDTHLERGMLRRMAFTDGMLFIYSVSCYVESYLGNQQDYTPLRSFLSALDYSLIVFILVNIVLIMYPRHSTTFWIPAVLNCLLCFVSIKTGIVFYFTTDNHFKRGMLGYLTYYICALYLIYFIISIFQSARKRVEDYTLPVFMAATSILCLVMPLIFEDMTLHWFNITIAIDIVFYYIYILQQYTKRDSLTNLLNRQSYYIDAKKYLHSITAYVAIDMNGLKEINDRDGHLAGDLALKTLADCFWSVANHNHRVYRIGGDEYAILCKNTPEEEVKELTDRIKASLKPTGYSCSIGYAMKTPNSTLDTLYQEADAKLYAEKRKYYEESGKKRQRRP